MLTLAIDTATNAQAMALVRGDRLIARRTHIGKPNHAETLLHNVDDLLSQSGSKVADLELLTVGIGPGSFTGVRVGVATAKALALAAGCPIVGVSTLAAMARPVVSAIPTAIVLAAIDARRGEIYTDVFSMSDGVFRSHIGADALRPEQFSDLLTNHGVTHVVGNALQKVPTFTDVVDASQSLALAQPWNGPSAPSIAFLGQQRFSVEGGDELTELEPNYVRLSDAEIALAKRVP